MLLIARPTDLAKRCELLPAGDQAAASGDAVTFARHLGPFDDSLRGTDGRRISFVTVLWFSEFALNHEKSIRVYI